MYQIIFSDIDGTLINSEYQVSEKTKLAICNAVKNGKLFVPISARMPKAIQPIIDTIGISSPIISYNGALIQDEDGSVLLSQTMKTELAIEICQFIANHCETVAWNVYSYHKWLAQEEDNDWIDREENIVQVVPERVPITKLEELPVVHKLLLMGPPSVIAPLEQILKKSYPSLSIAKSAPFFIEIMADGIEKGQAVAYFAKKKQINLVDAVAFGDNYNDLDMLRTVGIGVVMGNAPEDIRKEFDYVTTDNNHDGIAEALEKLDEE